MPDIVVDTAFLSEQMGDKAKEFTECIRIVQDIIENPDHYIGNASNQVCQYVGWV